MNATRLKTEFMFDPIGIDIDRPRLFWNCEGGEAQTAYQIQAADDTGRTLWDSGKVESAAMRAAWGGAPVPPRTAVRWQVRLWAENGQPGDWAAAAFETGLPKGEPWAAEWIAGDYTPRKNVRYPVDCFQKNFTARDIQKARLYITACGLYEAQLNGQKAGDFVLAPGHTDYRRRVQYQTYDVTALLREGENTLTVQLADGWYRGSCGAWGLLNQYGRQTKLLARLDITHPDGSVDAVVTDSSWRWSNDGPIRSADNKDGEVVDARRAPGYNGRARAVRHDQGVIPTASNNVPITEHERFKPQALRTPSGKTVLDFGQNIAGYLAFTVDAHAGQTVKLRFGEMLDKNGEFTQCNIQCVNKKKTTPLQQVEYTCREGHNEYKTKFAIFGFQYVLIEGNAPLRAEDCTAIAVYSDMEQTGWFESSNELLNKLFSCTVWSTKNNHADLPTDCPTRERHGWTGDAQLFCPTACYLFDYDTMARKYERDLTDAQHKNGCFTQIAPPGGVDSYMNAMDGSAGWSDAGVFIPYDVWTQYGDADFPAENYEAMRRYTTFKINTLGRHYLTGLPTGISRKYRKYISNYGQSYGEWAEPDDVCAFKVADFVSPHPEETTAYIVLLLDRMAEIARVLGRETDAADYAAKAAQVREGYQHLLASKKHSLDTDRQAKLVRPLALGLLNKRQAEYAKKRLLQAMEHYGWRLGTGFLSTPFILYVLADIGIEYAYRLLENEELPGWLCMPKKGATTIWENWEGPEREKPSSLDHYSKGAVFQWVFDSMCGIRVAGENHFVIAPQPGGHFTHAKASYLSVYGRVESGWVREGGTTTFTITVPANCTATVHLPDGSSYEQVPGTKIYTHTGRGAKEGTVQ